MVYNNIEMRKESATLVLAQKITRRSGRIEELKVWKVKASLKYPDGIRYRLVYVDPRTKDVLLLFDNHYPKGHHVHWGEIEKEYEYRGSRKLMEDFRKAVDGLEKELKK